MNSAERSKAMRIELLRAIEAIPGCSAKDLSNLLGYNTMTVTSALKAMTMRGQLRYETRTQVIKGRKSEVRVFFIGDGKPCNWGAARRSSPKTKATPKTKAVSVQPEPPKITPAPAPVPDTNVSVQFLREKLRELEEWKAWAIVLYPDLEVSSTVIQARKLFSKQFTDHKVNLEILSGAKDKSPAMLALIEALSA